MVRNNVLSGKLKTYRSRPRRKICVVTGGRAEYGLLRTVMRAIRQDPRLRLQVVAAGAHVTRLFGDTIAFIRDDGFDIDATVRMTPRSDSSAAMARSVGRGIEGMVTALEVLRPDIVLILGDRVEALAAAVAGAYMNIAVAHIHGGDSAKAGLDENARHAITKLAHLHFAATRKSAERIRKLGEPSDRIFVVGGPGIDEIAGAKAAPRTELATRFGVTGSKPLAVVVQHPVTTEPANASQQIQATLAAIADLGIQALVIYPNADAGARTMISIMESFARSHSLIQVHRSLSRADFLGLMRIADVLVGNSSSGIIEAPSFSLPVVNIGSRQHGRERGLNVIDVDYDRQAIAAAIRKALTPAFVARARRGKNPYGDGHAGNRIANVLCSVKIGAEFMQKQITY